MQARLGHISDVCVFQNHILSPAKFQIYVCIFEYHTLAPAMYQMCVCATMTSLIKYVSVCICLCMCVYWLVKLAAHLFKTIRNKPQFCVVVWDLTVEL